MRACLFTFVLFFTSGIHAQVYYVRFPDDVSDAICDGTFAFGAPEVFNPDSLNIVFDYHDEIIEGLPDICIEIRRSWVVRNADTFDPQQLCTEVPNPDPALFPENPSNWPGPVIAPAGTLPPWAPTLSKIQPTDAEPTDFSQFWSADANCYHYVQHIRVEDAEGPVLYNCPGNALTVQDSSLNDPQLWHSSEWLDPQTGGNDLKEGAVDLSLTASDLCHGVNLNPGYLLFLDLDQDGVTESVVISGNPPPPGMIRFNNVGTPGYAGGELRPFDQRGLPAGESYRFALEKTIVDGQQTIAVRWNTLQSPTTFVVPQLPPGSHSIKWVIDDYCGNLSICDAGFNLVSPLVDAPEPDKDREMTLFPVEPNPVDDQALVRFFLPRPGQACLRVCDAAGRLIFQQSGEWPAGEQSILLKTELLKGATGLLCCILESEGQIRMRKMILK